MPLFALMIRTAYDNVLIPMLAKNSYILSIAFSLSIFSFLIYIAIVVDDHEYHFLFEIAESYLHKSQPSQVIVHAKHWVAVSNNNNVEASVWFPRLYLN